jgi:hypothetical protein
VLGDVHLVNPGSVGMAYEGEPGVACWAVFGPEVELKRSRFDAEAAADAVRATEYPGADEFAHEYVLAQYSAAEATAQFESVAAERAL